MHATNATKPAPIAAGNANTCLDCKVLPPFSVLLCPMHQAAEEMLMLLRQAQSPGISASWREHVRAIIARAEGR